uniref:Uncharacterized protein n=1 Tax=Anguilla anguilla TaxID=7936 RepID=A0A0E9TZK8_ANGAN
MFFKLTSSTRLCVLGLLILDINIQVYFE